MFNFPVIAEETSAKVTHHFNTKEVRNMETPTNTLLMIFNTQNVHV
jgi:hypothetical protein